MTKIVIVSGGTGGHVFPALALGDALTEMGYQIEFWTDERGYRYCGQSTLTFKVIHGTGLQGTLFQKLKSVLLLGQNYLKAFGPLKGVSAVIGFGGYLSLAPLLAAKTKGLKIVVHEQNSVLGLVNKLMAPVVDVLAVSYPGCHPRETLTGMPVRSELKGLMKDPNRPVTLGVIGGSQGARIFSTMIPAAIDTLEEPLKKKLHILQQARGEDIPALAKLYETMGVRATLQPFFEDMVSFYQTASLVISRAGASTLAELIATHTPSILVPLPTSAHEHQRRNSEALVALKGACQIDENKISAKELGEMMTKLLFNPAEMLGFEGNLKKAADELSVCDATKHLAEITHKLLQS